MSLLRIAAIAAVAVLWSTSAAAQPARTIHVPPSEYPPDVQPGEESLRVHVRYALGEDGRFTTCEVQRSSGHPSLDEASCKLLIERARFRPEPGTRRGRLILNWLGEGGNRLNPPGAPIPVSLHDEIFDTDYPMQAVDREQGGTVTYDVDVSESGVPLRCTVSESSGFEILDRQTCRIVMERSAFIPASNGSGGRARGVYRSRITWRYEGD